MENKIKRFAKSAGAAIGLLCFFGLFVWAETWLAKHLSVRTIGIIGLCVAFAGVTAILYLTKFRSETR